MDFDAFYLSSYYTSDRSSKSTTDQYQIQELLDFSLNKISGVYKCTPEKMLFEMIEGNIIARAQLQFSHPPLNYKVTMSSFSELSLSYFCCIYIYHQNDNQTTIKIPAFRSYNPAGVIPFVTHSQFLFTLKLTSALVKAAISGVPESELLYLKNCILQFHSYKSNKLMIDYMYIQVKVACYRKASPPTYPEYICAQIMKGTHLPREDTKEYLEGYLQFIKGETNETKLPLEYYSSILRIEKKLSWDLKVAYTELEVKATKNTRMLRLLPLIVDSLAYIETGTNYQEMKTEIDKLYQEFNDSVENIKNECILM